MMFTDWAAINRVQEIPANPTHIARFISDIARLGIERVWASVQEISRAHYTIGLADPTLGSGLVTDALNAISKVAPPRSWPKADQARFMTLPWDMQTVILKRESERDRAVRLAQNEAGVLRSQFKEIHDAKTTHAA